MEDLPTTAGNDILVENAGGGVMFKEIGDERTFNGILNQITDNIQSGRLKAGDALPAERTMAETMGVSRPAVREALRAQTESAAPCSTGERNGNSCGKEMHTT